MQAVFVIKNFKINLLGLPDLTSQYYKAVDAVGH